MGGMLYIFVLNCCCLLSVTAMCDRYTGSWSQGVLTECLRFRNFNFTPQMARCLPNTFINETSRGRYHCVGDATYCWYPCMCDIHQQCLGGSVYTDCSCDPNEPATDKAVAVSSTIPQSCFTPSGHECSWYAYCFRKMYPCDGMAKAFDAITFNEKFCKLYSDHYQQFTFGARLWIDQARQCHIATLLPLLSQAAGFTTCNDVATRASDSNIHCMTLGLYACALDWTDKFKIFWTLIGSETVPFVEQMRKIWELFSTSDHYNPVSERLPLEYSNISSIEILVQLRTRARNHVTAAKITNELAVQRNWANKGFTWFGYNTGSDVTGRGAQYKVQINTRILFAPKQQYDLNAPDAPDVNMTETHEVLSLANAVRNRTQLTIDGCTVDIVSMTACSDVDCKLSYLNVKALPKKIIPPPRNVNSGHVFRASVWFIFVGATVILLI